MGYCTALHTPIIPDTMIDSSGIQMVYTNDIRLADINLLMFIIIC